MPEVARDSGTNTVIPYGPRRVFLAFLFAPLAGPLGICVGMLVANPDISKIGGLG
jgi:hypothetical protein